MSDRSKIQQGNVFDGQSQGHFYGPVNQYFVPPPLEPTIDGPPNNLTTYGLSPDRFVGRDRDLARLHGLLQTQTQVAVAQALRSNIAGVSGLGGGGKSELALQYARAHLSDYPGGVVWLRAAAACRELVSFAQPRWFAQVDFTPLDTLEKQAAFCQAHWPNTTTNPPGRVLLILDDVTDFVGQVQRGFPVVGDRFRVLITSREKYLKPESRLDLEVLEPAAALALLSNLVGEARIAAEQATAEKLCEWLGYLPLGLELVGSYLAADPELSLAKMQQRLEQKRLAAKALTQVPATTTDDRGVAAAFELSWQALSQEAQRLAVLLGCFGPAPVLWAWVEGCLPNDDEEDLEAARAELVRLSLLERLGDRQYGLHPLIREFFAAKLMDRADYLDLKITVAGELLRATESISHTMTLDQVQDLGAVISRARAVAEWPDRAEAIGSFLALLNNQLSLLYYAQGLFGLAEVWAKRSLEIRERVMGADHPDTATSFNNLAELYRSQGRYEAAEPLYRRCVEIALEKLGQDHPNTQTFLGNFITFVQTVLKAGRAADLSDHPLTQSILQQLTPHPRRGASPCALQSARSAITHSWQPIDPVGGRTAVRPYPLRENRFSWGHIAMRPPISEICDHPFVATDRPGWRAYGGTPLADRLSRQKPDRDLERRSPHFLAHEPHKTRGVVRAGRRRGFA